MSGDSVAVGTASPIAISADDFADAGQRRAEFAGLGTEDRQGIAGPQAQCPAEVVRLLAVERQILPGMQRRAHKKSG